MMHRRPPHLMARKNKPLLVQQLWITHPPTPPTLSPDSPTPSEEGPPSDLDIILAELRQRHLGWGRDDEWWTHCLSLVQLEELEARIKVDFVEEKIRYDYFPRRKKFVLRMAGPFHETVAGLLEREIYLQLSQFENNDDQSIASLVRQIIPTRSVKLKLQDYSRHSPDASFGLWKVPMPGLIIEVSHSQKRKDLVHLAKDYIFGSNGVIRMVIGIDIDYHKNQRGARVIVWEPRDMADEAGIVRLNVVETLSIDFRAKDGSLVDGDGNSRLEIPLKVFGSPFDRPDIDDISACISVPLSKLSSMVLYGEEQAKVFGQTGAREARAHIPHRQEEFSRSPTRSPSESPSPNNDRESDEDYVDD